MSEETRKLRALSPEELYSQLTDAREELMNLRFQQATGELTDYNRIRYTRHQIARLLTIIREHELAGALGGEE